MKNIIKKSFPFCITIVLWYLSDPKWNPFGFLVIIPIFYYLITNAKHWFSFSVFMLFMLDFNAGTRFLFTGSFLLMNAINDFIGFFGKEKGFEPKAFVMFLGMLMLPFGIFTLLNSHYIFPAMANVLWLFAWVVVLYLPFVWLFNRIQNDR